MVDHLETLEISAPAKVNLFLAVTNKRSDGYHELVSFAIPVTLFDKLIITSHPGHPTLQTFFTPGRMFPTNQRSAAEKVFQSKANSIQKAFDWWIQNRCKPTASWKVEVIKNIPMGAGLAGGTADGAAILRALSEIFSMDPPSGDFVESLGSDMAFCLHRKPAWIRGRGEIVIPAELDETPELCLATPDFMISTKDAYQNLKKFQPPPNPSLVRSDKTISCKELFEMSVNPFQHSAMKTHPILRNLATSLYDLGAYHVSMTGSGPTLFGAFPTKTAAKKAASALSSQGYWSCAIHGSSM